METDTPVAGWPEVAPFIRLIPAGLGAKLIDEVVLIIGEASKDVVESFEIFGKSPSRW